MKSLLLSLALVLSLGTYAQIGASAPDFTVTDLDGQTHNLYEYLEDGYVVIFDVSAVWCGPCWSFHNTHALQMMHEQYGADGTDQVRVIFYEGDANTPDSYLSGGGNSLGDWLEGSTYPFINESPISVNLGVYAPQGFPTVNIIDPGTGTIVADPWNGDFDDVVDAINNNTDIVLGQVNSIEESATSAALTVFPNPMSDQLTIDMSTVDESIDRLVMTDLAGRVVIESAVLRQGMETVDTSALTEGIYFISLVSGQEIIATQKVVK